MVASSEEEGLIVVFGKVARVDGGLERVVKAFNAGGKQDDGMRKGKMRRDFIRDRGYIYGIGTKKREGAQ